MVDPQWGQFQSPKDFQPEKREAKLPEFKTSEQEVYAESTPMWSDLNSPTTYQGEVDPTADEDWLSYLARNLSANASRAGEIVAGTPGNIQQFGKGLKKVAANKLREQNNFITNSIAELISPSRWEELVKKNPEVEANLPTSENLKDLSSKLTGGYTLPKTKGEKNLQEFTEDVAGTLQPGGAINFFRNLAIPAAANVAKRIVKDNGFSENLANLAKTAVWIPLSLVAGVNGPRYASQLMNQGRQGMPSTLQFNVPRFQRNLRAIERDPHFLNADPRNALARQQLNGLQTDLGNGQNTVRSLMTAYDGLNAAKRSRDMFSLTRSDQAFARRSIDRVRDAIRDEIMQSGASHPEALQSWRNGLQAWATVHQSQALTKWVESIAKGPYAKVLSGPAAGLFGLSAYGGTTHPLLSSTAGAAVPAAYKTGQVLYRMWNNPDLARYYWDAIGAAQAQNLPAFINNYQKLEKKIEKSTPIQKDHKGKK